MFNPLYQSGGDSSRHHLSESALGLINQSRLYSVYLKKRQEQITASGQERLLEEELDDIGFCLEVFEDVNIIDSVGESTLKQALNKAVDLARANPIPGCLEEANSSSGEAYQSPEPNKSHVRFGIVTDWNRVPVPPQRQPFTSPGQFNDDGFWPSSHSHQQQSNGFWPTADYSHQYQQPQSHGFRPDPRNYSHQRFHEEPPVRRTPMGHERDYNYDYSNTDSYSLDPEPQAETGRTQYPNPMNNRMRNSSSGPRDINRMETDMQNLSTGDPRSSHSNPKGPQNVGARPRPANTNQPNRNSGRPAKPAVDSLTPDQIAKITREKMKKAFGVTTNANPRHHPISARGGPRHGVPRHAFRLPVNRPGFPARPAGVPPNRAAVPRAPPLSGPTAPVLPSNQIPASRRSPPEKRGPMKPVRLETVSLAEKVRKVKDKLASKPEAKKSVFWDAIKAAELAAVESRANNSIASDVETCAGDGVENENDYLNSTTDEDSSSEGSRVQPPLTPKKVTPKKAVPKNVTPKKTTPTKARSNIVKSKATKPGRVTKIKLPFPKPKSSPPKSSKAVGTASPNTKNTQIHRKASNKQNTSSEKPRKGHQLPKPKKKNVSQPISDNSDSEYEPQVTSNKKRRKRVLEMSDDDDQSLQSSMGSVRSESELSSVLSSTGTGETGSPAKINYLTVKSNSQTAELPANVEETIIVRRHKKRKKEVENVIPSRPVPTPLEPPANPRGYIIGARDTVVNPGLCKVKIEVDYIKPVAVKPEPPDRPCVEQDFEFDNDTSPTTENLDVVDVDGQMETLFNEGEPFETNNMIVEELDLSMNDDEEEFCPIKIRPLASLLETEEDFEGDWNDNGNDTVELEDSVNEPDDRMETSASSVLELENENEEPNLCSIDSVCSQTGPLEENGDFKGRIIIESVTSLQQQPVSVPENDGNANFDVEENEVDNADAEYEFEHESNVAVEPKSELRIESVTSVQAQPGGSENDQAGYGHQYEEEDW